MTTAIVHVPVKERNAWPMATVLIVLILVGGGVWFVGAATNSQDGYSVPLMPASQPTYLLDTGPISTAVALALSSPTPSPTHTPESTPTRLITDEMRYGLCRPGLPAGKTCVPATHVPLTATPFPTCEPNYKVWQAVCSVPGSSEDVSAETETK